MDSVGGLTMTKESTMVARRPQECWQKLERLRNGLSNRLALSVPKTARKRRPWPEESTVLREMSTLKVPGKQESVISLKRRILPAAMAMEVNIAAARVVSSNVCRKTCLSGRGAGGVRVVWSSNIRVGKRARVWIARLMYSCWGPNARLFFGEKGARRSRRVGRERIGPDKRSKAVVIGEKAFGEDRARRRRWRARKGVERREA